MPGPNFGEKWGDENCYCYAVHRTGSWCDPGGFSGRDWSSQDLRAFRAAVVADGCIPVPGGVAPPVNSRHAHHLIAIRGGSTTLGTYHVLRRDESTGWWYQKLPDSAPGYFKDETFNARTDSWALSPKLAILAQRSYDVWIGYYWAHDQGVQPPNGGNRCCVIL